MCRPPRQWARRLPGEEVIKPLQEPLVGVLARLLASRGDRELKKVSRGDMLIPRQRSLVFVIQFLLTSAHYARVSEGNEALRTWRRLSVSQDARNMALNGRPTPGFEAGQHQMHKAQRNRPTSNRNAPPRTSQTPDPQTQTRPQTPPQTPDPDPRPQTPDPRPRPRPQTQTQTQTPDPQTQTPIDPRPQTSRPPDPRPQTPDPRPPDPQTPDPDPYPRPQTQTPRPPDPRPPDPRPARPQTPDPRPQTRSRRETRTKRQAQLKQRILHRGDKFGQVKSSPAKSTKILSSHANSSPCPSSPVKSCQVHLTPVKSSHAMPSPLRLATPPEWPAMTVSVFSPTLNLVPPPVPFPRLGVLGDPFSSPPPFRDHPGPGITNALTMRREGPLFPALTCHNPCGGGTEHTTTVTIPMHSTTPCTLPSFPHDPLPLARLLPRPPSPSYPFNNLKPRHPASALNP
nr:extensin-like [Penaeus vannamei]